MTRQRLTALATDWPRRVAIGDAELDEDLGALFEAHEEGGAVRMTYDCEVLMGRA